MRKNKTAVPSLRINSKNPLKSNAFIFGKKAHTKQSNYNKCVYKWKKKYNWPLTALSWLPTICLAMNAAMAAGDVEGRRCVDKQRKKMIWQSLGYDRVQSKRSVYL